MKSVGIVGGIAPESTIQYYRLIISAYREQRRDGSYPLVLINSIDLTRMLGLVAANERGPLSEYLVGEVEKLARAGADFAVLASNTPHIVFDEIRRQSPLPMISIVEAAAEAARALQLKTVGLFGTRFTMQGRFYPSVFSRQGMAIVVPDEDDQAYVHDKYMNELVKGVFREETRERLLTIVDRLKTKHGVEGVVLGGTELPLLLREAPDRAVPFLDTTAIHVERIVETLLS